MAEPRVLQAWAPQAWVPQALASQARVLQAFAPDMGAARMRSDTQASLD